MGDPSCQSLPFPSLPFLSLPRPRFDKSDSYQVFGAKQMPQVVGLGFLFFFPFCLHRLYRSFGVLVPILLRHFSQDHFRFFDSASGGKPTRRLGNQPGKKTKVNSSLAASLNNNYSKIYTYNLLKSLGNLLPTSVHLPNTMLTLIHSM